jgi:hypothetical protein
MIRFQCTNCNHKLSVSDDLAGRRIKCRYCSAAQTAPLEAPEDPVQEGASGQGLKENVTTEPWYFRYGETGTKVLMVLSLAAFVLMAPWTTYLFLWNVFDIIGKGQGVSQALHVGVLSVGWLIPGFLLTVWSIFVLCFALVLLDMARSLRGLLRAASKTQSRL